MDGEKLLLTVTEAAQLTSVSRGTGYELAASGVWPTVRIGRSVRVPRAALEEWVRRQAENSREATE